MAGRRILVRLEIGAGYGRDAGRKRLGGDRNGAAIIFFAIER